MDHSNPILSGRFHFMVLLVIALATPLAAQARPFEVDYSDYMHVVGVVPVGDLARGMVIREGLAYIVHSDGYLDIWDVSEPLAATRLIHHQIAGQPIYLRFLDDDVAVLWTVDRGLVTLDLSNIESIEELGDLDPPDSGTLVGLFDRFVVMNRTTWGQIVIDATDPTNMQVIASFDSPGGPLRTFCTFGGAAYTTAQFQGLMVLDVSDPLNIHVTAQYEEYDNYGDWGEVSVIGDHLYLATDIGLYAWDLSIPTQPAMVGEMPAVGRTVFTEDGPGRMVAAGDNGVLVHDISDPTAPTELGGALIGEVQHIGRVDEFLLTLAEQSELVVVVDGVAPAIPLTGSVDLPVGAYDWHAHGSRLATLSQDAEVMMIDAGDPTRPEIVATFNPCEPYLRRIFVNDKLVAVVGDTVGVYLFDWPPGAAPVQAGVYRSSHVLTDVALVDDYAIVVAKEYGLLVLDVTDPWHPLKVGEWAVDWHTDGELDDLVVGDGLALARFGWWEFYDHYSHTVVVDISDPVSPTRVATLPTSPLGIMRDRLLVRRSGYHTSNLEIISLVDPGSPEVICTIETAYQDPSPIAFNDPYLYVRENFRGITVFDLSDPTLPDRFLTTWIRSVEGASGDALWITRDYSTLKAFPWHSTGTTQVNDGSEQEPDVPSVSHSLHCYPNPFNPVIRIAFSVERSGPVAVSVFDAKGHRVAVLHDGLVQIGEQIVEWRGQDDSGRELASGTYFVRMTDDDRVAVQKVMLVR